jgi:putative tricarboxylic transport membrane protein
MLTFGVIGFVLRQLNFPMAPLVLGIVLGDILEKNLRRGLVLQDGDLTPFFTRPISFVMFAIVAATILLNIPVVHDAAAAGWRRATGVLRRRNETGT